MTSKDEELNNLLKLLLKKVKEIGHIVVAIIDLIALKR